MLRNSSYQMIQTDRSRVKGWERDGTPNLASDNHFLLWGKSQKAATWTSHRLRICVYVMRFKSPFAWNWLFQLWCKVVEHVWQKTACEKGLCIFSSALHSVLATNQTDYFKNWRHSKWIWICVSNFKLNLCIFIKGNEWIAPTELNEEVMIKNPHGAITTVDIRFLKIS